MCAQQSRIPAGANPAALALAGRGCEAKRQGVPSNRESERTHGSFQPQMNYGSVVALYGAPTGHETGEGQISGLTAYGVIRMRMETNSCADDLGRSEHIGNFI